MMCSTTSSFRKAFGSLPSDIQERARTAFARFREDGAEIGCGSSPFERRPRPRDGNMRVAHE